jgi:hypothetical protein
MPLNWMRPTPACDRRLAELYDAGELIAMTVDGKTQRGTAHGDVRAQHRMGAMLADDALMVAQLDVDGKSNEINAFAPLLDQTARTAAGYGPAPSPQPWPSCAATPSAPYACTNIAEATRWARDDFQHPLIALAHDVRMRSVLGGPGG